MSIHVVPDLLQFMVLRSRVEDLDGLPTINLSETPLEGWSRFVKRGFDLVVAAAALIVFSPVMLIVAIAIWLDDRGPIFYRQVRMGLDGKPFDIVKFRSMRVGAENETGAVWAEKDDPRRTRVGRFIRALVARRAAAALERARRRHERGRPAPRAPAVRRTVPRRVPALHAPPQSPRRHDRLGAGPRLARQHLDPHAHRARPLLHRELVAACST